MSLRFVSIVAIAGLASAAAFVPSNDVLRGQASVGGQPVPWFAIAGYVLATISWLIAGAVATRGQVVKPWLQGPAAGLIAAAISAWLVWLPAVHVFALSDLWVAALQIRRGLPVSADVIGVSINELLHVGVIGFWLHLGLGALMGFVGTVISRRRRQPRPGGDVRTPILWPLRMWLWSVALVVGSIVALKQPLIELIWLQAGERGPLSPLELLLINGAVLGGLVAGPAGATATRHARSGNPALKRMSLWLYGGLGLPAGILWVAVVPLLEPAVLEPTPAFVAYAVAPWLAALIGGVLVRRDPPAPVPRLTDVFGETLALMLLTGPLVVGAGLGSLSWATIMGPMVWGNVLSGISGWSSLSLTVAEILSMQAFAWVPLLAVPLLEGMLVFFPALLILRRRARREAVQPAVEPATQQADAPDATDTLDAPDALYTPPIRPPVLDTPEPITAIDGPTALDVPTTRIPDLTDDQRPTDLFEDFSDLDDTGDLEYIDIDESGGAEDDLEYIEIEDDGTMEDDVETERVRVVDPADAPLPPVRTRRLADRSLPPPVPDGLRSITPASGTRADDVMRTSDSGSRVRPASD